jgi:polyisoprenyl-teichoic acid--peptidoglycan teichoic acid transferase
VKKRSRLAAVLLTAFILILIALAVTVIYCMSRLNRFSSSKLSAGTAAVISGKPVNILVTGTDLSGQRTDTIMILSIDSAAGTLKAVSVPRDTMVTYSGRRMKINALNGIGGAPLLVSKTQELLGVDINFYASINYEGFDKMVDSIGGVDMTIPYNMNYDDPAQNLHIHFTKGQTLHLNGKAAEEFFRWRKNNDGTGLAEGDIGRTGNQHLLVGKIFDKVKSPAGLIRVPALLNTASAYVKTDMTPGDIAKYSAAILRIKKANRVMTTLKGSTPYIGGVSYFVYDKSKNADVIAALS